MHFLRQIVHSVSQAVKQRLRQWTKPDNHTLVLNTSKVTSTGLGSFERG